MRTVINGQGVDVTNSVSIWLTSQKQLTLANLYLIGEVEDPTSIWITDWSTPLIWSAWGTFHPGNIKRGSVSSKVGFEVATLDVSWTPSNQTFTNSIITTSPFQQAWLGKFDGATFRSWTVFMPAPGDANTFGAAELFGGRIGNVEVARGQIKFTVNSFLDVVNQNVPGSIIESLNTIAGFKGATPPPGLTQVPTFSIVTSVPGLLTAACLSPVADQIFADHLFIDGFIQMTSGALIQMASAIADSYSAVSGGVTYNQFVLYTPFPWNPHLGDTFYASATFPINQTDGQYFGFPFVPGSENAFQ